MGGNLAPHHLLNARHQGFLSVPPPGKRQIETGALENFVQLKSSVTRSNAILERLSASKTSKRLTLHIFKFLIFFFFSLKTKKFVGLGFRSAVPVKRAAKRCHYESPHCKVLSAFQYYPDGDASRQLCLGASRIRCRRARRKSASQSASFKASLTSSPCPLQFISELFYVFVSF